MYIPGNTDTKVHIRYYYYYIEWYLTVRFNLQFNSYGIAGWEWWAMYVLIFYVVNGYIIISYAFLVGLIS